MASSFQSVIEHVGTFLPAIERPRAEYREIYNQHCHRIYSLAFYMTDNELVAEQLAGNTFLRAFAGSRDQRSEQIDHAFVAELRDLCVIGNLTLNATTATAGKGIRDNMKRVHLERAVVQLPATERLIFLLHDVEQYDHARIAVLLGLSEEESRFGLHQARIAVREAVGQMI